MKRLTVFMAIISLISWASHVFAKDYKVIQRISVPSDVEVRSLTISPDGNMMAYVSIKDKKSSVWINDKKVSHEFDSVGWDLFFNPDGSKLIYTAESGEKWSIYVNDKRVTPEFDWLDVGTDMFRTIVFNSDVSVIAYAAKSRGKKSVWVNDKRVSEFEDTISLHLSPNGRKVAYVDMRKDKEWLLILYDTMTNSKEVFGKVAGAGIVLTDSIVAYVSRKCERVWREMRRIWVDVCEEFMVVNGKATSPSFYRVGSPALSPDGRRLAYSASVLSEGDFIVIDGRRASPIFKEVSQLSEPVFSPDSNKIAYSVESRGKLSIMVDDKRVSPESDMPRSPLVRIVFSPDSNRIAYLVKTTIYDKESKMYKFRDFIMVGDKRISPELENASIPTIPIFSPDGSKVAYRVWGFKDEVSRLKGSISIWINDKKVTPEFDEVDFAWKYFNKTGELIFAGYDKEKREIIHALSLVTETVKGVEVKRSHLNQEPLPGFYPLKAGSVLQSRRSPLTLPRPSALRPQKERW